MVSSQKFCRNARDEENLTLTAYTSSKSERNFMGQNENSYIAHGDFLYWISKVYWKPLRCKHFCLKRFQDPLWWKELGSWSIRVTNKFHCKVHSSAIWNVPLTSIGLCFISFLLFLFDIETVEKTLWFDVFGYAWQFHLNGLAHAGPNSTSVISIHLFARNSFFLKKKAGLEITGLCIITGSVMYALVLGICSYLEVLILV